MSMERQEVPWYQRFKTRAVLAGLVAAIVLTFWGERFGLSDTHVTTLVVGIFGLVGALVGGHTITDAAGRFQGVRDPRALAIEIVRGVLAEVFDEDDEECSGASPSPPTPVGVAESPSTPPAVSEEKDEVGP